VEGSRCEGFAAHAAPIDSQEGCPPTSTMP